MPGVYASMLAEHRRLLEKVSGKRGAAAAKMKHVYDRAQADVVNRITKLAGRGSAPFTVNMNALFLRQIRHGQAVMVDRMTNGLADVSRAASMDAAHAAIGGVKAMERLVRGGAPVLPVEEAGRLMGLVDKRRPSLLHLHKTSFARYGARIVGDMQEDLAVNLVSGGTVEDAVQAIQKRAQNEYWQAERIVRTESAFSIGATTADSTRELAKAVPDLWQRWTEHVSDTGEPLDDRVGEDSIVLHGQVTRPGGLFTMPPDPKVWKGMWGETWAHPPNRPNDRSVVVPWSPRWGAGPGWVWRGAKVPVTS